MEGRKAFVVLGHGYELLEQVEVPPNEVVIYSAKAGTSTEEVDVQNVIKMFINRELPASIMQPQITADTDVSDVKEFLNNQDTATLLYARKPSQFIHDQLITFESTFVDEYDNTITFKKAGIYRDLSRFSIDDDDIENALTVCTIPIITTPDMSLLPYENLIKIYEDSLYPKISVLVAKCKQLNFMHKNNEGKPCLYYHEYMSLIKMFDLDVRKIFAMCPNSTIALMVCRNTEDDDKIRNSFNIEGFGYKRSGKTKRRKIKRTKQHRKTKRNKTKRTKRRRV